MSDDVVITFLKEANCIYTGTTQPSIWYADDQ